MSFIGSKPSQTLATPTSQYFNGTGSQTVFTLNRAVNVAEDLEVFVNNIQQEPGVGKSYTAVGTTLTFDAAPSSGTANVYVVYRGLAEVTTRLEHDPNAALAATTGTFSGAFTSPGIDDNATSTAMTLDANSNVGIGTSSPDLKLHVDGSNGYPAASGSTPVGHIAIRAKNESSSHGAHIGVGDSPPWATWIQAQDINNLATSYPLLLNPNGGNVGIGDNNPTQKLSVNGNIKVDAGSTGYIQGPTGEMLIGEDTGGLYIGAGFGVNPSIPFYIGHANTSSYNFRLGGSGGGNNVLVIDSSGRVTMPYQPVFSAILDSSPTAVSNAIIPVNSAIVNIGNHFNNSTYTFTAPVSGNYFLSYFVRYNGYQASIYLHPRFYKNGSALFETHQIASTGGAPGYTSLTWSGVVQLAANDAITLGDASQGSVTLGTYQASQTGFTGHLIG